MADQTSEKTRRASGIAADETRQRLGALPPRERERDDRPAFLTFLAGIVLVAVLLWQGGLVELLVRPADDTVAAALTARSTVRSSTPFGLAARPTRRRQQSQPLKRPA